MTASRSVPIREQLRRGYLRRVIAPTLRASGPRLTDRIARRVGDGLFRLGPPIREIAIHRAARALGETRTHTEIRQIVAGSFEHAARFWGESLFVRRRLVPDQWQHFVSFGAPSNPAKQTSTTALDGLIDLVRSKRGCILTTAYYGNPVAAVAVLGHIFGRVHVVADFDAAGLLGIWSDDLRQMPQISLIQRRDATRRIPTILESGGAVLTIGEHHRLRGGLTVRWLGADVRAYPTIGLLSRATRAPVVPFLCSRSDDTFRFRVDVLDCIDPTRGNDDPHQIVRDSLLALERGISHCPEQYLWAMSAATV